MYANEDGAGCDGYYYRPREPLRSIGRIICGDGAAGGDKHGSYHDNRVECQENPDPVVYVVLDVHVFPRFVDTRGRPGKREPPELPVLNCRYDTRSLFFSILERHQPGQ